MQYTRISWPTLLFIGKVPSIVHRTVSTTKHQQQIISEALVNTMLAAPEGIRWRLLKFQPLKARSAHRYNTDKTQTPSMALSSALR